MGKKNKRGCDNKNLSRSVISFLAVTVCFFLSLSSGANGEIIDRIVANVNGEIILYSELRRQMIIFRGMKERGTMNVTEDKLAPREVLQTMIDEKIMANYAKEKEIAVKENDVDKRIEQVLESNKLTEKTLITMLEGDGMDMEQYRERIRTQIMIQRITSYDMPPITISREDVSRYYRLNQDKFKSDVRIRASHLVLLATSDTSQERIKEVEEEIIRHYAEIMEGADFAKMAKKYSQDGAAVKGGDLGWFGKGSMLPEFESVAFGLEEGEISKPIRTKFGYHIIKITGKEKATVLSIEDTKEEISELLRRETFNEKRKTWIDRLRDQAYVQIIY